MNKMKKILTFLMSIILFAELIGCSKTDNSSSNQNKDDTDAQALQPMEGDSLVIYFSRTGEQYVVGVIDEGNTAIVAKMIADTTGADLFEILPEDDHYPTAYAELTDVAKTEQNENARPAYAGKVPDLSKYSTIFIGAPVCWGDWPMIKYTFFEENADALSGKNLVPFSTHEGSGLSGFDSKLTAACPDSNVLEGLAIRENDAQNNREEVKETVNTWFKKSRLINSRDFFMENDICHNSQLHFTPVF